MGTIYVRERRKMEKGERKPRFRVVAVADVKLKFKADHLRKLELEEIAKVSGAELVYLPTDGERKGGGREL